MLLDQNLCVFAPGGLIVGSGLQDRRQQNLGIVIHLAPNADSREQPLRLNVIPLRLEEMPYPGFGGVQVTIHEQTSREHDFGGQLTQCRDVAFSEVGIGRVTGHAEQSRQRAPTAGERMVAMHGLQECLGGLRGVALDHVAVAAFLVEPAEGRMMLLELGESLE